MWVRRPYIDGLTSLWLGFSLGAADQNFDAFSRWVRTDRFPVEGGYPNPLSLDGIVRGAITGAHDIALTREQDDQAVALLIELLHEFEGETRAT